MKHFRTVPAPAFDGRRPFFAVAVAAAGICAAFAASASAADTPAASGTARRPNVVLFLADDLGWGDLACYGHPRMKTPHLDRFAKEGLRFTQCYSACGVCSPSRSALLTGRTPYRNGVFRWIPAGSEVHLRTSEITIATLLRQAGYATCHSGKWHLNGKFSSPEQPQPGDHGFDHWFSTQNNAAPSHKDPNNFVRNGQPAGPLEGFSAVLVVDEAVRWLEGRKTKDAPFFLAVWTHEPHLPIESDPRFMDEYRDIEDEGIRQHHGNVTQLDFAFGRLMQALDKVGATHDTFVFFTSDNGPEGKGTDGRTRGSTGGLRGRKRHTYEGGIRVPGIARWPGRIRPGTESDVPVIGTDFLPTVCAMTGLAVPSDRPIDGTSLVPLFEGKPIERKLPLYWRNHLAPLESRVGLRIGDWKIVASDDLGKFELYDVQHDPQEKSEVSAQHPEKLAELKAALVAHDKAVLAEGPDWWKRDESATKKPAAPQPEGAPQPKNRKKQSAAPR